MSIFIDDMDKNRFTKQIEITSGSSSVVYFQLSGTGDVFGDMEINTFVNVNCTSACVGCRYDGGSFFLSSDGGIYNDDFGDKSTIINDNADLLSVSINGEGYYGIMKILYANNSPTENMTIVSNINFLNIEKGSYFIENQNPPPP